jgi:hypothetical protein
MKIDPGCEQNGPGPAGRGEIEFAVAAFKTVAVGDPERACCANK